MNVKDFCLLKWKDVDGNVISFVRERTKRTKKETEKATQNYLSSFETDQLKEATLALTDFNKKAANNVEPI